MGSHQGGGSEPPGPQLRSPLPPALGQITKPPPRSMWPLQCFTLRGVGKGDGRGEGGLVSKLGCNLRESPGSVGSGKPSWGGKAPHLAEKGGALGCGDGGPTTSPPTYTPCPGQAGFWEPKGPCPFTESPFPDPEANKPPGKGLGATEPISSRNPGPRVGFILVSPAPSLPLKLHRGSSAPKPRPVSGHSPLRCGPKRLALSRCSVRTCCPRAFRCRGH